MLIPDNGHAQGPLQDVVDLAIEFAVEDCPDTSEGDILAMRTVIAQAIKEHLLCAEPVEVLEIKIGRRTLCIQTELLEEKPQLISDVLTPKAPR
jgi:hypothetical protein